MAVRKTAPRKSVAKKQPAKAAPKKANAKGATPGNTDPYVAYSDALADQVCAYVAEGNSIRAIAATKGMPSKSAIFKWLAEHEAFRSKYELATAERAQARYESIDDILADLRSGRIDHRQARVMIDAVKWQCTIERPDRYNPANRHEHTGRNGGPIATQPAEMTPEQRREEIRKLLGENPQFIHQLGAAAP